MAIVNNINSSKSSQSDRLEKYAADLYQNQLKDDNTSKYVTLNLNVFERYGYDVSYFDSSSCSRTESYAVIALDDDGNIDKISTNLSCEEADNE